MRELVLQAVWYEPDMRNLFSLVILGVDILTIGSSHEENGSIYEVCVLGVGLQLCWVDKE